MIVWYKKKILSWHIHQVMFVSRIRSDLTRNRPYNHVLSFSQHIYFQWNNSLNIDFALLKLINCSNLDIKDTACLPVVEYCNIQHHTLVQSQYIMPNLVYWTRRFNHLCLINTANEQSILHHDMTLRMNARVTTQKKWSNLYEHCAAYNLKNSVG